jgi:hypothetical protein
MDISTMYVAEIIHRERLAQAEQARQWAQYAVTIRLRDRVRQALSARLISWGTRRYVPTPSVEAHA